MFCRVFHGVLVYFKDTLRMQCSLCISPSLLYCHKGLSLVTYTCMSTHIQIHTQTPIIVPMGTQWWPITTTGGTKKTSFILLSRCPSLSFWFDFSFCMLLFSLSLGLFFLYLCLWHYCLCIASFLCCFVILPHPCSDTGSLERGLVMCSRLPG